MKKIAVSVLSILLLVACSSKQLSELEKNGPKRTAQWINPLFFNDNFDPELSFPVWFDDSLIRANNIAKITKRIFPRLLDEGSKHEDFRETMPKEKREYYFDRNGFVDRLVVYHYFDDREIARASFYFQGNMDNNGYRKVNPNAFRYLSDNGENTDFTTNAEEREYNYIIYKPEQRKSKFVSYTDVETNDKLFFLKNKKNWGPLSVDSILKPAPNDWIVWGTARKPYKRYKVKNKVSERHVHLYNYWKSGVLKQRIVQDYPFEYHRSYTFNERNQWISYIDSTFSDQIFITRSVNVFEFDAQGKPILLQHTKETLQEKPYFYLETFNYEFHTN